MANVQLWDATTGHGIMQFTEHRERAWSINFSQVDSTKLASGSDDCSVKIWNINEVDEHIARDIIKHMLLDHLNLLYKSHLPMPAMALVEYTDTALDGRSIPRLCINSQQRALMERCLSQRAMAL